MMWLNEICLQVTESRCQETQALLQSRQAALLKARRQMEFDSQSFVDLNEVLDSEDPSPFAWLVGTPLNASGRKRSGPSSNGSRTRESLSRCSSLDTNEDSFYSELNCNKQPLESRGSLGGIREVRESSEDLDRNHCFASMTNSVSSRSASNGVGPEGIDSSQANANNSINNRHTKLSSTSNSRDMFSSLRYNSFHSSSQTSDTPLSSLPPLASPEESPRKRYLSSTDSSNSSASHSSCESRSGGTSAITPQAANHKFIQRANAWPFSSLDESRHENHDG